ESNHTRVSRHHQLRRIIRRMDPAHDQRCRLPRKQQSQSRCHKPEHRTLHHHHLHQSCASSTNRNTQCHLSCPGRRLCRHQVSHIRAGDQQHHSHQHAQSHQRRTIVGL